MATAANSVAANPAAAAPRQSRAMARSALAALVAGLLFLALAAGVAIGFLRAAFLEQAADDGWPVVGGRIVGERTGWNIILPDPDAPGGVTVNFQLHPQIQVRYLIDGTELETWVDVMPDGSLNSSISYHRNLAEEALTRFRYGDAVVCYYDPDDPSSLRLAAGNSGRRTALIGCILAGVLTIPAVGLLLASWLLWRLRPPLPLPAAEHRAEGAAPSPQAAPTP